jgi:hypothetical protein
MRVDIDFTDVGYGIPDVGETFRRKRGYTLYLRVDTRYIEDLEFEDKRGRGGKVSMAKTFDMDRYFFGVRVDTGIIHYFKKEDAYNCVVMPTKVVMDMEAIDEG